MNKPTPEANEAWRAWKPKHWLDAGIEYDAFMAGWDARQDKIEQLGMRNFERIVQSRAADVHHDCVPKCKNCGQIAEAHGTCNTCPVFVRLGEPVNSSGATVTWWEPADVPTTPTMARSLRQWAGYDQENAGTRRIAGPVRETDSLPAASTGENEQ